ncbi:MAG: radical SAM protein [Planctomycetota bacterium]
MNIRFCYRVLKTYVNYRRGRPTPSNLSLRIVYRCNLKCNFCQFWKINGIEESSLERIKLLIDDLVRLELPYLNITGGEPLLRPDLDEIAAYASEKGIYLALNTNGTLITENRARALGRYFDVIKISLDGFQATHDAIRGVEGAFHRANVGINNLMKADKRRAKVFVHLVGNEKNVHEIPEFVKKYKSIVDRVSIMPYFSIVEDKVYDSQEFVDTWQEADQEHTLNESESMIKKPKLSDGKRMCDAATLYYSVLPDGKIICCPHFPLELGNIKEQRFYDVWSARLTQEQKAVIDTCPGCYAKCTTEVSRLMRKSPIELMRSAPKMVRKHMG